MRGRKIIAVGAALGALGWALPAWAQDPGGEPPFETGGDEPPFETGGDEPPFETGGEEPPFSTGEPSTPTDPEEKPTSETPDDPAALEAPVSGPGSIVGATKLPSGPRYRQFGCGPSVQDRRYKDHYFVCIDTRNNRIAYADVVPSYGKPLLPNKPTLVVVIHQSDHGVAIETDGKTGVFTPGVDRGKAEGGERVFGAGNEKYADSAKWVTTTTVIPPLLPGEASVTVKLSNEDALLDQKTITLLVQETYSGALRAGIGAVTLGAVDGTYSIRNRAGSPQAEIIAEDPALYNVEFVLGYAAFLDEGGRPAAGCLSAPWCFAPYVGVGVLSQDGRGDYRALSSMHLGLEWQPVRNFSIAATLVGRRTDQLAAGLRVGGPANPGDEIITQGYGLGAGIVFNISPSFFRFAAGGLPGGGP